MFPTETSATLFGTPRRPSICRVDPRLRMRVRTLRTQTCEALRISAATLMSADPSGEFSPEAVTAMARLCVARLAVLLTVDEGAARPLLALVLDLQQLALDLHLDEAALLTQRLGECADGLGRLRTLPTSRDLMEAACQELVSRCGFGRAVLSRVESGRWVPMIA